MIIQLCYVTMWSHTIYIKILSEPLPPTLTQTHLMTHAMIQTFRHTMTQKNTDKNHPTLTISHFMTAPDALGFCQIIFHDNICAPNSQHSWMTKPSLQCHTTTNTFIKTSDKVQLGTKILYIVLRFTVHS